MIIMNVADFEGKSYGSRGPFGKQPPSIRGMISLKVENLSYRIGPYELRNAFKSFGLLGDVYIPKDKYNKESRGFGFVRYYDSRDAEEAIYQMDGASLDGRELKVQLAQHHRPGGDSGYINDRQRSIWEARKCYKKSKSRSRSRSRSSTRSRSPWSSPSSSRSTTPSITPTSSIRSDVAE